MEDVKDKVLTELIGLETAQIVASKAGETIEDLESFFSSGHFAPEMIKSKVNEIKHLLWVTQDAVKEVQTNISKVLGE